MRKTILLIVFLLFVKVDVFATDACDRLVPREANFIWQVTIGANLRSYPCTYKSSVLWVSRVWDKYRVISQVDGWYQVKMDNWKIYRIWDKAIVKTTDTIDKYEIIKPEVVKQKYTFTIRDKVIINKFTYKAKKIIQEKWITYKAILVSQLSNLLEKRNYSLRVSSVLEEIINNINLIQEDQDLDSSVINTHTYDLKNIDISKVKNAWLSWYNWVRKDLWKNLYSYDSKLESTALDWSKTSKARWDITHKRNSWDVYYDYTKITSWFKDRGVICKNIYRATNTENIWWWQYSCNDWECSDELISAIKSTFNFYMSEKGETYQAHYKSIVHPYFTKIWLWIEIEELSSWYYKYYLTVHYCTELID